MKKLIKLLTCLMLACVSAFALTACGGDPDDGGNNPPPHTHEYTTVTEYFDGVLERFPKTLKCSCGETSTKTAMEVTTADQLMAISRYINEGDHYCYKIAILNDIDMTGLSWTPIDIEVDDTRKVYEFTGAEGGVKIKNVTSTAYSEGGLFGQVSTKLTVKNITIEDSSFTATNTGAFAGFIDGTNEVKFINCGVNNCTINGSASAGALYGTAHTYDSSDRLVITVTAPVITNNTINGTGYVGGLAGRATSCLSAKPEYSISLTVTDWTFSGNNCYAINSEEQNIAGCVFGLLGNGKIQIPEVGNDILASNSAYLNTVKVEGREYGRTDWTSRDTEGLYMNGIAMLHYDGNGVVNS